jgi:hypothetical protein
MLLADDPQRPGPRSRASGAALVVERLAASLARRLPG